MKLGWTQAQSRGEMAAQPLTCRGLEQGVNQCGLPHGFAKIDKQLEEAEI